MKTKTASVITDLDTARRALAPMKVRSCFTIEDVSHLVPGSPILIAVAKERYEPYSFKPSVSNEVCLAWGPAEHGAASLIDEAEDCMVHHDENYDSTAAIVLGMNLRQFIRLMQELYHELPPSLQPFAQHAKYAKVVTYRGASYRLVEK
jgi:hypothetical protein